MEVSRDIQDFDFGSPTFAETSRDNLALESEPNGKCGDTRNFCGSCMEVQIQFDGFCD